MRTAVITAWQDMPIGAIEARTSKNWLTTFWLNWSLSPLDDTHATNRPRTYGQAYHRCRRDSNITVQNNIILNSFSVHYYIHRLMNLSTIIREASICSTWWLTLRPMTGKSIEKKIPLLGCSVINGTYVFHTSLPTCRNHCWRGNIKSWNIRGAG